MKYKLLETLLHYRQHNKPVALLSDLDTARQALITPDNVHGELHLNEKEYQEVLVRLAQDDSGCLRTSTRQVFVAVFVPRFRLVIIGAVHVTQALLPIAQSLNYDTIVIDPRQNFATTTRFPNTNLRQQWPDDCLPLLSLNTQTAVLTLTHDPKIDDPALSYALSTPVFYIGALGSQKTHAQRLIRLQKNGLTTQQLQRIHAPIGLNIGAKTPAEIALAILAQITSIRREKRRKEKKEVVS